MLVDHDVCDCDCHHDKGVFHIMPCCGVCPYCKERIRSLASDLGDLDPHTPECKARFEQQGRKWIETLIKNGDLDESQRDDALTKWMEAPLRDEFAP